MSVYSVKGEKRRFSIIRFVFLVLIGIGIITISLDIISCANKKKPTEVIKMSIEEVLKKHTPELMSIPGVVGTAQGKKNGKDCVLVLVIKKTPEITKKIPSSLEGFPVVIQETGEIRSLDTP